MAVYFNGKKFIQIRNLQIEKEEMALYPQGYMQKEYSSQAPQMASNGYEILNPSL